MSIKINLHNSLKYKTTQESGQESTIQPQPQEQQKPTIERAQSRLSKFIDSVREAASQKLKTNSGKRQFKSTTEGIKEGDELEEALSYAKYTERNRNSISKGVEKGRAYLNATAEVGAKSSLEFAKNDIAQTKENFAKNVNTTIEAGKKASEAVVGAVLQMGEGAKVLNKMAAEGLDKSREKSAEALKWLGGKGREAWGGLKSMKDRLIQGGKDKVKSTKKSIGEKLVVQGMKMRGVETSSSKDSEPRINQKSELASGITQEKKDQLKKPTTLTRLKDLAARISGEESY
jgi:hypothetical protein